MWRIRVTTVSMEKLTVPFLFIVASVGIAFSSIKKVSVAMEKLTIFFLLIVAGVGIAFNSIKVSIVAMEMQQCVPFTLLSSYKIS